MIRSAAPEDAAVLAALGKKTFIDAFSADNTAENLSLFVAQNYGEAIQAREIADPERRIFIAWEKDQAVGYSHLLLGKPELCIQSPLPIELLRLYVDQSWHGKGVAHQLMEHAVGVATELGRKTLWLGVWEQNLRAQAFYRKWGFREIGSHVFWVGEDPQRDLLLEKDL